MEPFAYRPIPVMGESFSSYLMRTAANNCSDIISLIREIKTAPKLNEMVLYHQIDSNPKEKLNLDLVMYLTGLKPTQLSSMTYMPLYQKFVDTEEIDFVFKSVLCKQTEVQYRRFCPVCLQQYCEQGKKGVFQLYWQIKEIEHCHIHDIPLTSICPKCGVKQRYITSKLGDYICFECGYELFGDNKPNMVRALNDCNNQIFQLWDYLLDSGKKGLIKKPGLKYEVQMAITLMYLLHKKDDRGRADLAPLLSKLERRKALLFIQNRDTNLFVTPYRLSTILRRANVTAAEFFNTIATNDFIELITERLGIEDEELAQLEEKKIKKQAVQHKWAPERVKKLVIDYLQQRPKNKIPATNKEVYSNIPVSNSSVTSEVAKYVTEMVKEYNRQQKEAIYKEIEEVAIELLNEGRIFTYKVLADRVGVHVMFIKRDKEIINRINVVKETFGLIAAPIVAL